MRDKDAATGKGGAVWVWAGVGIAIAIAAGSYVMVQKRAAPTEEEMATLLSEDALEAAPQVTDSAAQGHNEIGTPSVAVAPLPSAEMEDDATQDAAKNTVASGEDAAAAQTDDAEAAPDAASDAGETSVVPSIDEVRLATDGVAVIAGRASPGATVEVLVDGEVVTSAQTDAGGAFAAVGMVAAGSTARVLSLRSMDGDVTVRSTDEVILAPVATPPVEAAKAETAAVAGTSEALAKDAPASQVETEQAESVAKISNAPQSLAGSEEIASLDAESLPPEETATADDATQEQEVAPSGEGDVSTETASVAQAQDPEAPAPSEEATSAPKSPQVALLKSDEEGVTLLQTAPEPPARVQLDTIGYTDSGVVQLAGRASSEAVEVRVYLNNRVAATLSVADAGGWRGEVPDVDAGVYTLRVDEIDAQGAVTSRVETPFKRETPEVLAAATAGAKGPAAAVTVQRGDTLWAIARDRYGEGLLYVQVFEANRSAIRDPDLIYPGQLFALPPE